MIVIHPSRRSRRGLIKIMLISILIYLERIIVLIIIIIINKTKQNKTKQNKTKQNKTKQNKNGSLTFSINGIGIDKEENVLITIIDTLKPKLGTELYVTFDCYSIKRNWYGRSGICTNRNRSFIALACSKCY